MRIFELAQELQTTSGEVLRLARALDLDARSTLSRLDNDDVQTLTRSMASQPSGARQVPGKTQALLAAKRKRAAQQRDAKAAAERQALEAAISRAREAHARASGEAPDTKPSRKTDAPVEAAAAAPATGTPDVPEKTLKIEPLPPVEVEGKVIIHAAVETLEPAEKTGSHAAEDDDRDSHGVEIDPDEEFDPDEELATAYLGRQAKTPQTSKAHPMRPKETRDVDLPRPPAGKRGAAAAAKTPASRRGTRDAAGRAAQAQDRREEAAQARGQKGGIPRGLQQGIPRGQQGIVRGKQDGGIPRGLQQGIPRGQQGIVRGKQDAGIPRGKQGGIPRGKQTATERGATPARQRFAPVVSSAPSADKVIQLRGPIPLKDLAEMMGIRPNRLIADLMQLNVLVSINQRVDIERAGKIAEKYGYTVEMERTRRSATRKPTIKRLDEEDDIPEDQPEDMKPRPPVVTFLGHVDHGKTSLMDYIREAKVVAGEAGGITQHIGAYSVEVAGRKITFLDTPGHAAFSAMRARGANLTDIAVIIIAADDGIMPQTREVIRQAQQAGVQLMVAINKCDLPSAKPDRVRQQLQGEGLTPEEWGGDLIVCEVSAMTGQGVDHLLEMILLQADMLELEANPDRRADGYVIEAQLELGRGPTATLLVSSGTLKQGDVVLIGEHFGRLRGLVDDRGRKVLKAGPATAVRVMGLSGVPEAGAEFRVMVNEKRARELAEKFAQERKDAELTAASRTVTMDTLLEKLTEQEKKQLNVIVKGDTQGSVEAIVDSLRDIRSEKIALEIINTGVGNISTTDVQRAAASDSLVVGFQVGLDTGVAALARHENVRAQTFRIIYELFDHVKQAMLDLLDPEYREVHKGEAQIRAIFDIGRKGRVAGCQLLGGTIATRFRVRIKRAREVIFDGRIASLRHFQDEVPEVSDLQECGIFFDGFEDFAEGDIVECYAMEELERTL